MVDTDKIYTTLTNESFETVKPVITNKYNNDIVPDEDNMKDNIVDFYQNQSNKKIVYKSLFL